MAELANDTKLDDAAPSFDMGEEASSPKFSFANGSQLVGGSKQFL
jgi:hypothetical protein